MRSFGWKKRTDDLKAPPKGDHQSRSTNHEEDEGGTAKSQWKPMKPKLQEDNKDDSEFHTGAEDTSCDPENEPDPHPSAGTSAASPAAGYPHSNIGSSRRTTPASSPPTERNTIIPRHRRDTL